MTLQDGLFILMGFLAGVFVSWIYFSRDAKKHRKEVEEKLKFLEDNPSRKGSSYQDREN